MFNSICDTCASGAIVEKINKWDQVSSDQISFSIILDGSFTEIDAQNFSTIYQTNIEVNVAEGRLNEMWNSFANEFRKSELNNIVFVLDHNKRILNAMSPNCKCSKNFFSYVEGFL